MKRSHNDTIQFILRRRASNSIGHGRREPAQQRSSLSTMFWHEPTIGNNDPATRQTAALVQDSAWNPHRPRADSGATLECETESRRPADFRFRQSSPSPSEPPFREQPDNLRFQNASRQTKLRLSSLFRDIREISIRPKSASRHRQAPASVACPTAPVAETTS